MLSRSGLAVGLWLLLSPFLAHADTSLVATGGVDTGYATNIRGTAETTEPLPGQEVQADGFMNLRPGLSAAYERARGVHNLNYVFGARLFLRNSDANAYSNTLTYQSLLTLSARSSLRLGAAFNAGQISTFDDAGNDLVNPGDALPPGDVGFITYSAAGTYRRLISSNYTGSASLTAARFEPDSELVGETTNMEQRFTLERRFRYHLLGLDTRLAFNKQVANEETQKTLTTGPGMFWTWDVTDSISTTASAGLDIVGEYPTLSRGLAVPRAGGALTYSHERGRATAGWAYGTATNIFGGDTTINNQAFLNIGLPLPFERPMAVTAAAAYAKGRIIDVESGDDRGRTKRLSADVSLAMELTRAWNLGLRAETSTQDLTNITEMGDEDSVIKQSIITLVLQGRFPENVAAQVPRQSSDRVGSGNASFQNEATPQGPGGGSLER